MHLFLLKRKSRFHRPRALPIPLFGTGSGFTLIEIAVVILLISIMLLVAVPRLPDSPLTDQTRKTKRWIMLKVQDLKERAVRDQKTYTLHIGIDSRQLWITSDDMSDESKEQAQKKAFKLDEDLKVLDVEYPGDEIIESGRADILFYAKGYSDRAIIHMSDSDARFSFQIEPFLSNVKLYDAYTGFDE